MLKPMSWFFVTARVIPARLAVLAVAAGFLTLVYYFFYFKGLESDSPSIVIALFGLAPATIPLLAHFLVHERLFAMEIVGFMIVLIASLGLAVTDVRRFKFSKALMPMVMAVVFMDAVSIMTKYVYQQTDFYPAYLYFSVGMGLGGVFFLLLKFSDNKKAIRTIGKTIKKLLPVFVVAELFGLSAEFTLNLAISRGPVSLVKVIEGVQPMFVLLISFGLYPLLPSTLEKPEPAGFSRS
jgi:drug/metabolite transporter (DMT)-like permease